MRRSAVIAFCIFIAALLPAGLLAQPSAVDDVFYHFMPIAWRDSNNDPQRFGDFGGMTASLDYLEELGITAVWMNPIFPSPAYHGYQHGAADQLNAWFGSEAQFLDFVQQAHARGIKVFVDLVCYGISHNSIWFQSAYGNPNSPYDAWLAFTNGANTNYQGYTFTTWNGGAVGFIHWDLRNPNPVNLVTDWSKHWLDPNDDGDPSDGIDGYRLDHVWVQYGSGPDGWGYNLDDFWEPWKAAQQTVNPDVFTFAEQADWGSFGGELLTAHDAAFTKPFEFAARDALSNELAAPLYSGMAATVAAVPAGKTFLGIIGDHDVDRITSVIGGDLPRAKAAAAVLMLQPFPPVIYHGDEIGMLGVKQDYGSDANDIPMREPFKWNAVAGQPMSNYFVLNAQAYNNRFSQDNDGRSVQEQQGVPTSLLETYRTLITTRKNHVALRQGTYHELPNSSTRVWSFLRHMAGQQTLLIAINVHGTVQNLTLNLSNVTVLGRSSQVQDVLTGGSLTNLTAGNQSAYPLTLPAYGFSILNMNVVPNAPLPQVIDGLSIPSDVGPGHLIATQNNATGLGDNLNEINQLFVRVQGRGLTVGITGNLATDATGLAVFFDTVPGGQNVLQTASFSTPPNGIPQISGLVLDSGFAPDRIVFVNAFGGSVYVDLYTLNTGGGGMKRYVGAGTVNDGDGFLVGGTNPNGMLLALNNSNVAGVTATDAAPAATATSGFEATLPFTDLGISGAGGTIKMMAMLVRPNGEVGNQFLPGLGGGYGNLGFVPINLNDIPGQQFALLALSSSPGDWNGDGDVDLADYGQLHPCLTGPAGGAFGPGCGLFDFDSDIDVDLDDAGVFMNAVTGAP